MKRVLIIDDEIDLCILVKSYLSKKDCEVHTAHTLNDGLRKLENLLPDSLLLDNNLPDGMGWLEVEYLHKKFPNMHITLLSAYHLPKDFGAKVDSSIHILEKPITLNDIDNYL